MARIKTRIDSIDRDVRVIFEEHVSPEARSRMLANFARSELVEAQHKNLSVLGFLPDHETFVDGRETTNLDSVRPDGRIMFEFQLVSEVFDYIYRLLYEKSPVGKEDDPRPGHPGAYRASHILTADGQRVPEGTLPPPADEYAFVNIQPYARKIERGLSNQAPDGVYQVAAGMAQDRFGNVARIRFSYRSPVVGEVNRWAETTRMQTRRVRDRFEWLRRQPAIVVNLR